MDTYITGAIIRKLREEKNMTQAELAEKLSISDKAVSKWETGKGYPDITLIKPLTAALGISVAELLSGKDVSNTNRSFNMLRLKIYVCPICGNVIIASGEAVISCCGISLPPLDPEEPDESHKLLISKVEDELYLTMNHEMNKQHYISFIASVTDSGPELIKLYPEGPCEARVKMRKVKYLYYYCNRHGLFKVRVDRKGQII